MNVHIRWMIRRDVAEVFEIENHVAEYPWPENDFITVLWQRDMLGMVAEDDYQVVGFAVYELYRDHLQILNIAVHPELQRQGIGRQILQRIKNKPAVAHRALVKLHVRETNLIAQRFFSVMGFKAVSIVRDCYRDPIEDAYLMEYRPGKTETPPDRFDLASEA